MTLSPGVSELADPSPSPPGRDAWRAAREILVVRLDNLGDVLMTTPAIAAIAGGGNAGGGNAGGGNVGAGNVGARNVGARSVGARSVGARSADASSADPAAPRITLLTSRAGAAVKDHVPCIDDVIVYDAPWVRGTTRSGQADRRLMGRLAQRHFDAAVIFTVCTQSALPAALFCRMAGIRLRLAYSRENPYALLSNVLRDDEVPGDGMRHEVDRQLDLVRSVGFETASAPGLLFQPTPAEFDGARRQLVAAGVDPARPYLVVHPGSTAASRRWPAERFGVAARRIAATSGLQVVVASGPDEHADAARTLAACGLPAVSLAGALTLGELAAAIAGARLVLCNNSGPAHLAAAVGTPVVVLYALTNPQHTPWRVPARVLNHDVPCRNCLKSVCPQVHHACLLGVDADAVVAAALDLLAETAAVPGGLRIGETV